MQTPPRIIVEAKADHVSWVPVLALDHKVVIMFVV